MVRAVTFLGASCVGKTSVFDLIEKDRSFARFAKIGSITRQLVKEGKIEPSFTSVQNQKLIFDKYAELLNTDCYVSDRSIIDVHTFTKTIPVSTQRDAELKRQLDFINVSEYFLPIFFYFPIYWDVENDGERMADAERRKCWDTEIRKFLIERKLPYEVIPNDTPFNRLKFIKSVLSTRINLG
jgi:hypothetical protein|nr:MAG TPA: TRANSCRIPTIONAL REGULATOR NADR, NMN, NMN Adenylyl transferase [Caudoviricetes sp.]